MNGVVNPRVIWSSHWRYPVVSGNGLPGVARRPTRVIGGDFVFSDDDDGIWKPLEPNGIELRKGDKSHSFKALKAPAAPKKPGFFQRLFGGRKGKTPDN